MKVILLKNCKDGKVNEVIDVSLGYGTNFLINKGFAEPFNTSTKHQLDQRLLNQTKELEIKRQKALVIKKQLEDLTLVFTLKSTNDVIHGSITTKRINEELRKKEVILEKHSISDVHIKSFGITIIKVNLFPSVTANLKVQVNKEG